MLPSKVRREGRKAFRSCSPKAEESEDPEAKFQKADSTLGSHILLLLKHTHQK